MHEAFIGETGGDLAAETAGERRFVHDDATPCPRDGAEDGRHVERLQRSHIDDFGGDPLLGKPVGDCECLADERPPGDQRHVLAFAQHETAVKRSRCAIVNNFFLRSPVPPFGLEEDDGIGIANCCEQQPVGLRRRRRNDDADAGNMRKHRFGAFRVMLGSMDAPAEGGAQHHRTGQASARPVAQTAHMVHHLVQGRIDKAHELN
jgi:hypothetical protein